MPSETILFSHAGFLQMPVAAGRIDDNLNAMVKALRQLSPPPGSLLVLPEMWASGFVYSELATLGERTPEILQRLQEQGARYGITLAGSVIETERRNGVSQYYNTLFVVNGSGLAGCYRKQQPFRRWQEDQYFQAGTAPQPVTTPWGRLGCLICYDLRFADLARLQSQRGADLLICPAMWPLGRIHHWRALLVARAIENQTFIIGGNAVGTSGEALLGGHSLVVSPDGDILLEGGEGQQGALVALDWPKRDEVRGRLNSLAENALRFPAASKIQTVEQCHDQWQARRRVGQRGAVVAVQQFSAAQLSWWEEQRRQCDFLVAFIKEEHSQQTSELAAIVAGLCCIDAVVVACRQTGLEQLEMPILHLAG